MSITSLIASWSSDRREIKGVVGLLLRFDAFVEIIVLTMVSGYFPCQMSPEIHVRLDCGVEGSFEMRGTFVRDGIGLAGWTLQSMVLWTPQGFTPASRVPCIPRYMGPRRGRCWIFCTWWLFGFGDAGYVIGECLARGMVFQK